MFKTKITLHYDPNLDLDPEKPFWLIGRADPGIGMYYQKLLNMEKHVDLAKPAWNTHVSVVRGEEPAIAGTWRKYPRREIEIEYDPTILSNRLHYWLKVYSKELEDIRTEMGLSRLPYIFIDGSKLDIDFHLTIGNLELYLPSWLTVEQMQQIKDDAQRELDAVIASGVEFTDETYILRMKIHRLSDRLKRAAISR